MSKKEFAMIAMSIKAAYPNSKVLMDEAAMNLWYRMLGDLDYRVCETAMMQLFTTHKYPPTISEIREECAQYEGMPAEDAGEAWGLVKRAIRVFGYYREEEALQSLPEAVKKAVERLGFKEICTDDNEVACRAHFFQIYNATVEREKQNALLPPVVKDNREKMIAQNRTAQIGWNPVRQERLEEAKTNPETVQRLMDQFRNCPVMNQ